MISFMNGYVKQVRLSTLEKKAMNDMFVILSDVWLDSSEVFTFVLVPNTN
jgi:hypothetical protein